MEKTLCLFNFFLFVWLFLGVFLFLKFWKKIKLKKKQKKKIVVVKFELNHSCGLHFIGLLKVLNTSCH
jgi:hypothetical protein